MKTAMLRMPPSMSPSSGDLKNFARAGPIMKCPPWLNESVASAQFPTLWHPQKHVTRFWAYGYRKQQKNSRRLLNFGEFIQSHALSFFHLTSPDLLLGFESPPEKRNLLGVLERHPQVAQTASDFAGSVRT